MANMLEGSRCVAHLGVDKSRERKKNRLEINHIQGMLENNDT